MTTILILLCLALRLGQVQTQGFCSAGKHRNGDDCADCEPGYCCPGDNSTSQCLPGTYSNNNGTGSISCNDCAPGTESPAGSSSSNCTNCSSGLYSTGGTPCTSCPPGQTSYNRLICQGCPEGTYSPNGFCLPCPPGTASNYTGVVSLEVCKTCDWHTYAYAGQPNCTHCPDGTFYNATGGTNKDVCVLCNHGRYFDGINYYCQSECTDEEPCRLREELRRVHKLHEVRRLFPRLLHEASCGRCGGSLRHRLWREVLSVAHQSVRKVRLPLSQLLGLNIRLVHNLRQQHNRSGADWSPVLSLRPRLCDRPCE